MASQAPTQPDNSKSSVLTSAGKVVRRTTFLRRLASLPSQEDFSSRWSEHAALVAPLFQYHNILGYTQTHLATSARRSGVKVLEYDGMVDLYYDPETCSAVNSELGKGKPGWDAAERYFSEVVFVDEAKFWDRNGKGNVDGAVGWETGAISVMGWEKKVIVDGKIVIDVPEKVMERWNQYMAQV
jgi:EthD domain